MVDLLEARIIRITDTYDALTSNRGYRRAHTHKQAIRIMEQDQRFFDPELLEVFFKMQRGGKRKGTTDEMGKRDRGRFSGEYSPNPCSSAVKQALSIIHIKYLLYHSRSR